MPGNIGGEAIQAYLERPGHGGQVTARGAVAAGHPQTAEAAALLLEAGGNAFDAALAGLCAACVAEPVLTSLGGGGFLTARTAAGDTRVYDFFVQSPRNKRPLDEIELFPVVADFGTAQQEFHIGMGALATPGTVRGLFDVHRELGSVPMRRIVEPAVAIAREGVRLNRLQAYIFSIVAPIYLATPGARALYASPVDPRRLCGEGEVMRQPELADTLELLAMEGDRLFYEGDLARALVALCEESGGQLGAADLAGYRTCRRAPLQRNYRDARLYLNPPPSSGGLLIAFALALLADHGLDGAGFGTAEHLLTLARVMEQTNLARGTGPGDEQLLHDTWLGRYRHAVHGRPLATRGTTQISVVDNRGNAASLTLSNGEGCGHVLPGTGIMLNNMLGEEDLNPDGFHRWREDVRVSSMMAPTVAEHGGRVIALGSGGSNRLRTAILQTLCNLIDFGMPPDLAVSAPRIHLERGKLSIEPGLAADVVRLLTDHWPDHQVWDEPNLFFGGTHTVVYDGQQFAGAGDPRRGGVLRLVA
jgi:gamma-glutamyltranspeptidase / glutathione hydrolase